MPKPSFTVIPQIAIHPGHIDIFNTVEWSPYHPHFDRLAPIRDSDKKHHGKVSVQARRKVSKAVDYLLYLATDKQLPDTAIGKSYNFKIAFITLTLQSSQIHSDNCIKETLLNQFLIELRFRYKVSRYIWRAEKQKNGNIHFHILIDRFVPWSELRDRWNRICNKLGYVDRYRDEMRRFHNGDFKCRKDLLSTWSYKDQVKAYQKGKANDWNSPNSTDIHSLYHVRRVKEYILKYITKNETEKEISGRMWGCSESLSNITGGREVIDSQIKDEINRLIASDSKKIYKSEYFSVLHFTLDELEFYQCETLILIFSKYILNQFNFNFQYNFSPG
jgi:hypothetical protein